MFLSKETLGTDDLFEVMETRRAYLTFLANVFNADLENALSSESKYFLIGGITEFLPE
jgi:DNA phosphorothioation-dependent restriction protein DptG